MGCRGRRYLRAVAIAGLLLVTCVGCQLWARPRHGLIVRGDWSFEVNRVPWLSSRAKMDEECSQAVCECSPGCLVDGDISAGGEIPSGCTPATPAVAPPGLDDLSGPTCNDEACRICRGGGRQPFPGSVQPTLAMQYRHSRFHPVPTRPVFLPDPERYVDIEGDMDSAKMGSAEAASPQHRRAPLPSEVEVIPAPAPRPDPGWKGKDGQK